MLAFLLGFLYVGEPVKWVGRHTETPGPNQNDVLIDDYRLV